MKNPEQTARKRNKAEDPNCGQVVIIESPKRCCSGLGKKVKPKKLKCLVKETSSDLPDPKKKQSDSESKKEARASSPVVIESSSDSELLSDTKKRNKVFKKGKNRKLFCIQFQNSDGLDEGQPGTDLHASKKGSKTVLEVGRQDEELAMKRKKKKKEKRKDMPACLELLHSEQPVKLVSAELKPSCQGMLSSQKKSRMEQKVVGEEVEKKPFEYYEGNPENISKKDIASCKCQDAQSGDGPMQRQNNLACRSEEAIKKKKKKKKKKRNKINPASLSCLAKIQENHCDVTSEYSLKCESKKKAGIGKAPKQVNKAAKKKEAKRQTGDASRFSGAAQGILSKVGAAPGGKEKRKRAKKHKVERHDRDGFEGSQVQQVKKKRKNKEIENFQDGGKKAKTKQETKKQITEDELKLVAFRKGNCDEVNIDKVRRQALQEEIDRESGKTKIAKDGSDHRLGQWSTATFETQEQKTKFHRLMGGFKKGFVPAQSSPANANKPNMALDRPREQELQHNLEAEFKKAVEFKHHRGIGLGFQSSAPSGVHIEKYASKSIKFEV